MSLPDFSPQQRLFSVQGLPGLSFPSDDRFRLFAETIYPRLGAARPELAKCYFRDNGRAALEPVVLLGASVLQFMERVSDSEASERVTYHLGWKPALQLDLHPLAFHPTTLVHFRKRLLEHEQAKLAFDAVLHGLMEAGLVPKRGKQRLNSTHVRRQGGKYIVLHSGIVYAPASTAPFVFVLRCACRLRRNRRTRIRRLKGLCIVCGYDLRAHKPGDRCDECGTTVEHRRIPPNPLD